MARFAETEIKLINFIFKLTLDCVHSPTYGCTAIYPNKYPPSSLCFLHKVFDRGHLLMSPQKTETLLLLLIYFGYFLVIATMKHSEKCTQVISLLFMDVKIVDSATSHQ